MRQVRCVFDRGAGLNIFGEDFLCEICMLLMKSELPKILRSVVIKLSHDPRESRSLMKAGECLASVIFVVVKEVGKNSSSLHFIYRQVR